MQSQRMAVTFLVFGCVLTAILTFFLVVLLADCSPPPDTEWCINYCQPFDGVRYSAPNECFCWRARARDGAVL